MGREWKRYVNLIKERPADFDNSAGEYVIITDHERVVSYEREAKRTIGVVYESPYHLLVVDLVSSDGKHCFFYERLLPAVKNNSAVVALTICQKYFVLLKQYRHALRDWQYAFPRGYAESGLTPEENVYKELGEELGCHPSDVLAMNYLGCIVADSGVSGEKVKTYLCELGRYKEQKHHEGIEKAVLLSRQELTKAIHDGKINDSFSLSALSLYDAQYRV